MYRFSSVFLMSLLLGCTSADPIDAVFDPIEKTLETAVDVLTEVSEKPIDPNSVRRGLYKQKANEVAAELSHNKYYSSSAKNCRVPEYPSIPSKPVWACTSANISHYLRQCEIAGSMEYACGEFLEAQIEKTGRAIYSGTAAGAACTAVSGLMTSGQISKSDVIAAGLIGAIDNYGEQIMNEGGVGHFISGGILRVMAAGGKVGMVSNCKKNVNLSCDPTPIIDRIKLMKAEHTICERNLVKLNSYL